MIETAAIVWAVGATGLGLWAAVYAYKLERRNARQAGRLAQADLNIRRLEDWCEFYRRNCASTARTLTRIADELDAIKVKRHRSARHARKCQLDQYLARQRETTEKLKAGVGR